MDQAALENALQVLTQCPNRHFVLFFCIVQEGIRIFDFQDFIVNLAGMEFGAGAHPGLQVS